MPPSNRVDWPIDLEFAPLRFKCNIKINFFYSNKLSSNIQIGECLRTVHVMRATLLPMLALFKPTSAVSRRRAYWVVGFTSADVVLPERRIFVQRTRHVKTKDCMLATLQATKL